MRIISENHRQPRSVEGCREEADRCVSASLELQPRNGDVRSDEPNCGNETT